MLRTLRNVLLILAVLAGAGVAVLVVTAAAGMCGSDTTEVARSPSGTYAVRVETSGCGATTTNSAYVRLRKANWLGSERSLFTIEPAGAASVWSDPELAPMRFRWEGDSALVVEHRPGEAPPRRPARVLGVAVRYVSRSP